MNKSLFIATPAYGGHLTNQYTQSMLRTIVYLMQNQVTFSWFFMENESLINRARNRCAAAFLQSPQTHLLFIDSDIGWTTDDIGALLSTNVPIVGGTYPVKKLPISMNFNPLPDHEHYFSRGWKTEEEYDKWAAEQADAQGLIEVTHVPTGFMLIDRQAFRSLESQVSSYPHPNLQSGAIETHSDFFQTYVKDGVLLSEDWGFCELARENGIPIYLQSNVVTSHTGTYVFKKSSRRN